MKHLILSVALLASLAATGCAASAETDDDGGPTNEDAGLKADANKGNDSGNTQQDSGSQGQCVPTCTSDQDCENSCPLVPNGVNCCDTSTGICYAFASTTCPAPVQDAGFD